MIADRTSCATIYAVLIAVYPQPLYNFCFMMCFVLDFGSHFLQFCSSALMKSESHKGKNEKENFLVKYYYENFYFFITIVFGAEICSVFLVVMEKSEWFYDHILTWLCATFLCIALFIKMVINVF